MPILLLRVDERLIHGQVVIGWGRTLQPTHYLVVDDALAESAWEQELYLLAVDDGTTVSFRSVADASESWADWTASDDRIVLLTRNLETMRRLGEEGRFDGLSVNLGGIHHGPGRIAVRPYLNLDAEDRDHLRALAAGGARISGQDLPDGAAVSLDELLAE